MLFPVQYYRITMSTILGKRANRIIFIRMMEMDAAVHHNKYIFTDKASFHLAKTRRCGRNIIGQWTTIQVTGQCRGNISMCAAICENGMVGNRPVLGSYNAKHLIAFLQLLYYFNK